MKLGEVKMEIGLKNANVGVASLTAHSSRNTTANPFCHETSEVATWSCCGMPQELMTSGRHICRNIGTRFQFLTTTRSSNHGQNP